ncbi:Meiotic recombination protein dmc1 [Perkinsus olseni]|uniref:Meiotic recombination protein dmc1 n=2 Tax=Perkinsus olseni TaxID=32597 RepID=A0A7J6NEW7_PEROL|nr:Meiotic recombination protein dmc1 [Perkinsus olseni]
MAAVAAQVSPTATQDDFAAAVASMASPSKQTSVEKPKAKGRPRKDKTQTQSLPSPPAASSPSASAASPIEAHASGDVHMDMASDVEDDADEDFQEIEKLQDAGINAADLRKLKEAGLNTAMAVIYTTKRDLCSIKGLSEQKVEKIQEAARKLTSAGFITGSEFVRTKCKKRFRLSTGSSKVDQLLGGGVESCSITEFFGEFRCGKTQLCHSLSVIAQMPQSYGGANGKVCYIDTENTFRPDRITQIAQAFGVDPQQVLDNIIYARCYNSEHLVQLLLCVAAKMAEEKYALLVVDSIMGPFRVDFTGRGDLAERQQLLSRVMSRLQKLSEEYNLAVVITNQVMADPAAAMSFAANPPKPIGGHVLAHYSTTRIALRKGRGEQRIMKIIDSPNLPEGDCVFEICNKGIQDAKD